MNTPLLRLLAISFIYIADSIHPCSVRDSRMPVNRAVAISRYIIEKDGDDICISYPMVLGLDNGEIVNKLIKDHIYEIVRRRTGYYDVEIHYQCNVEFFKAYGMKAGGERRRWESDEQAAPIRSILI